MGFHTTTVSEEALREQNFNYISTSGIYDVTINAVSVTTNAKNARSLDFIVTYEGTKTTLYGLRLDNNDGSENFGRALFNKLCIIAGIEEVEDPETQTHILGKDKQPKDLQVLEQFSDLDIKIRIQYIYTNYQNKIRENREIRAFYRAEDGASAKEIATNTEAGVQLAKDIPYANKIVYKDDLTEEDIEAWKRDRSSKSIPTETKAQQTPEANPFAKK